MSSKTTDENENNTNEERQALESEINDLKKQINVFKKGLHGYYKNFLLTNKKLNASKTICTKQAKKIKLSPTALMRWRFYQKFLKVVLRPQTIRLSFPRHVKEQHGLQFRCISSEHKKYSLEKCFLPHTFNMQDERKNSIPLFYKEIPDYVRIVMENINAYSLREMQVDELKKIIEKGMIISYTTCYTDVDISFRILTLDSSVKKCVNVNLFYPMLGIIPNRIHITVEGDILLKRYLEAIFSVFKEDTLKIAYQKSFVNSDQLKFVI